MIGRSVTKGLSRNYDQLTPEERARLIVGAEFRDDGVERNRLHQSGGFISLSMRDHTPTVLAFFDVAMLIRIELLDTAALFRESLMIWEQDDQFRELRRRNRRRRERQGQHQAVKPTERSIPSPVPPRPRARDLAIAAGRLLREKFHGWRLFCERIGVPAHAGPPVAWERITRDVALAEALAFPEVILGEGFSRQGTPLTSKEYAEGAEQLYRTLRARWSGEDDDSGNPNSRPGVASSSTAMCR